MDHGRARVMPDRANVERRGSLGMAGANDLALFLGFFSGVVEVIFRRDLLPEKFFYDGDTIIAIAQGRIESGGDTSFGNVARIYQILGLSERPFIASFVGFSLFFLTLVMLRKRLEAAQLTFGSALAFYLASVLGGVYLGYYSKDVVVSVLVIACFGAYNNARVRLLIIISFMVVYGLMFRQYWLAVLLAFVLFRTLKILTFRARTLVATVAATSAVVSLFVFKWLDLSGPNAIRTSINDSRLGSPDAASAIGAFFRQDSVLAGVLNVVLALFLLTVPVALAMLGTPYYVFLAVCIAFIWSFVFRGVLGRRTALGNQFFVDSMCMILALVAVQAVFEPDYGSALRHWTPMLPFMLFVGFFVATLREVDRRSLV